MKRVLIALAIFAGVPSFAQSNIAVAIAKTAIDRNCGGGWTHLSEYEIVKGPESSAQLKRQAEKALQEKYKQAGKENFRVETISNTGNSGNFLTILSANIPNKTCKKISTFTYGIGFGKTKEESLKNAEINLKTIIWTGGKKYTYKIVKQEMIE